MKKIVAVIFVIIILLVSAIYLLIPATLIVSSISTINVTENAYRKFIIDNNTNWQKWWPSFTTTTENLNYKNYQFKIINKNINVVEIAAINDQDTIYTKLILAPLKTDTINVIWTTHFSTGSNPLKKVQTYQKAKELKSHFTELLNSMKKFLENDEAIYSFKIEKTKVNDPLLLSSKFNTHNYPATTEIYKAIKELKDQIILKNIKETGNPMLHVRMLDSSNYETMVAIPINKEMLFDNKFAIKKMILGNLLVTDVTGGVANIQKAYNALDTYILDHRLISPAMPYESLITNRFLESDTSKWKSKVYYPIF